MREAKRIGALRDLIRAVSREKRQNYWRGGNRGVWAQVCLQTKCMAELGFGGECFLFPDPV